MFNEFFDRVLKSFTQQPRKSSNPRRHTQYNAAIVEMLETRRMLTAPALAVPAAVTVAEGGVVGFTGTNSISISDSSGDTLALSLTAPNGTLTFASSSGLTVAGSGSGTLTASGSVADLNAALATLVYVPNSGFSGSDSVGLYVLNTNDNSSSDTSIAVTVDASVSAPVLKVPATVSVDMGKTAELNSTNTISVTDTSGGEEQFSLSVSHGTISLGSTTAVTVVGNNSSTLLVTGSTANLNAVLSTLVYTPDVSYSGADTMLVHVLNSGTTLTADATIAVTVNATSTAPTLTQPETITVAQGGVVAFTGTNAIRVTETTSVTEQFSMSAQNGTLTLGSTTGLTVSGNGSGTLQVTGSIADLNAALATLIYAPNTGFTGSDTLSLFVVSSNNQLTAAASIAVTVTAAPTKPTLTVPLSVSVDTGKTASLGGSNAITIADTNGGEENFSLVVSHGTVSLGSTTGVTTSGSGGTTILISGSTANVNAALLTLVYTPDTGFTGFDTMAMYVVNTSTTLSNSAAVAVTVNAVSTPPSLVRPATVTVAQDGVIGFTGANAISVVQTTDAAEQFSISAQNGTLTLGSTTGLSVTGNGSGSLLVSGSLADLNAALATLIYTPNAGFNGSDTLSMFVLSTSNQLSDSNTIAVTVTASITAPTLTAPATISVDPGASLPFSGVNAIGITDTNGGTEQFSLVVSHGTVALGSTKGVTVSGNGTGTLMITGSTANLSTVLSTLVYTPTSGFSGVDTMTMSVTNTVTNLSGGAVVSITVNASTTPPSLTKPATLSVTPGGTVAFTGSNAISVTETPGATEQFSMTAQNGKLTLGSTTGLAVVGNGSGTLFVSGSIANLNAALATLVYAPNAEFSGSDTLTLVVQSATNQLTDSGTIAVTVASVTAPSITAPVAVSVAQDSTVAFTGMKSIIVADSSGTTEQLSLSVEHGTLTFGSTTGLTVTGNGTGTVQVSGSLSDLNTALSSLTYAPTTGYTGSDTLTLTNLDTTTNLSGTASVAITVAVAPSITAPSTATVIQNGSLALVEANAISITDAGGTAEQLSLTVLHGTLTFATTTGLTITGNGTDTVSVSGSLSDLNAALATLTYTPTTGYSGSDTLNLTNLDTTTNLSATASVAISVAAAPSITAPTSVSAPQDGHLAFTGVNAISVTDTGGTAEQLTLSVQHGTLTFDSTTGLTVTGNGTASVSVSGSLSDLNAALATLAYAPSSGYTGSDTLSLTNLDTTTNLSATASVAITVAAAPSITAPSTVTVAENGSLAFTAVNAISVTDAGGTTEQLGLSVQHGTLTLATTTGLTVTGNGTDTVSVSGSLSDLNAALATLTYAPTTAYSGSDTLSLTNLDTTTNLSATASIAITVVGAPSITAPTTVSVAQDGSLPFTGVNAISVTDTGGTAEELSLSVQHGTLTFATTTGLTVTGNGTDAVTVSGSLTDLNAALATLTYAPTSAYSGSDTLSLTNLDTTTNLSASASVAITVAVAPSITAPSSVTVAQNGSLDFTAGNAISVTDAGGSAEQFSLSVEHGTLTFASTTGLTVTGNGTATVQVTGSLTDLNAALATLTYAPTTGYGGSDTLSLTNLDTTTNLSATASVAIAVVAAPSITAPTTASVAQDGMLAFTGVNAISVTDVSGTTEELSLSVQHGTLTFDSTTGLTVTGNGTDTVTVSGSLTDLNVALATLTYTPTAAYTGSDTLSLTNLDTTTNLSATASVAITVAAAPSLTAPSSVTVAQDGSLAFTAVNAISVTDAGGTAEQLSLSVQHGTLTFASTTGLTVTGNGTATVQVSGSLTDLNTALATLTYAPTTGYGGSDTLSLTNLDTTTNLSATASVAITVAAAPSITAPTVASVAQDSSLPFTGANAISVTDVSGTAEELSLSVQHGTLTFATTTGLTVTGNGTDTVTVSGSLSDLNAALATLTYAPTTGYTGSDTLSLTNLDTTTNLSGTASVAITVAVAPSITAPSSVTVAQDGSLAFTAVNAISVTDAGGTAEQLSLSVQHGTLTFATTTGLTVTGNGTDTVSVSGSLTDLNAALATLTYAPTAAYAGSDTLSLTNLDTTTNLSATASVAITVTGAPSITAPTAASVAQDGTLAFTDANAISVTDTGGTTEELSLSVQHGALTFGSTTGLTVTGNGTDTVTVSGSLSDLNAALATLTYAPTSAYTGSDMLSLTNLDTTTNLSGTASVAITVAVAPGITAPASASVEKNQTLNFADASTISVANTAGNDLQVTLSVQNGILTLDTGLTMTGNGTSTITITASGSTDLSNLNTVLASLTYTPTTDFTGSDTLNLTVLDTTTNLPASASVAITVAVAPTITAPTTASVAQDGSLAFTAANAISVTDDGGTAETLTLGVQHGTLTFGSTTGLSVTGNGTDTVTVSGSLSDLNTALASLTYAPTTGYTGSDTLNLTNLDTTTNLSGTASVAITVAVEPSITAPASVTVEKNQTLSFADASTISATNDAGNELQFTLSVQHGTLTFGSTNGLTVTGNGTSSVTVSGTAILADLNVVLASLTYTPTTDFTGSDTLNLTALDTTTNLPASASVAITVAVAPTITAPTTVSVAQDSSLAFTAGNAISVTDASGTTETLTLTVQHGTLTFGTSTGLSVTGDGTGTVTASGSLTDLNAALATLTYAPTTGYTGSDTLNLTNLDTTTNLSGTASVAITVAVAPSITAPASATVGQDSSLAFTAGNAISVTDAGGSTEQLTLSVLHGTLSFGSSTGLTVTGDGTDTVTVSGSLTDLNTALASLTYTPTAGYSGSDTLSLTNLDTTTNLSATSSVAITVAAPPTITAPTLILVPQDTTASFTAEDSISVADTGGTAEQLTLSAQHGTITFGTATGLTVTGDGTSSVLVSGSLSDLNTALATLTYTPTTGYTGSDVLTLTNLSTSTNLSDTVEVNISIIAA